MAKKGHSFHSGNLRVYNLDDSNIDISNPIWTFPISNIDIVFTQAQCRLHLITGFKRVMDHELQIAMIVRLASVGLFIFCVSLSEGWMMSCEESDSGMGSNSTTTVEQEKLSRCHSKMGPPFNRAPPRPHFTGKMGPPLRLSYSSSKPTPYK